MKKLLLSSALSLSAIMAFGQLDLAITEIVSPTTGTVVTDLQQVPSSFVVKNDGTTTLNVNDTIFFRNELNGSTQTYSSGGSTFNVFSLLLTKTLAPNDTVLVGITLPIAWLNAGVSPGGTFTWGFNVRGSTCCPTQDDADLTNNVMSVSLTAAGGVGIEETLLPSTEVYFNNNILFVEGQDISGGATVEVFNLLGQKMFESAIADANDFSEEFDLTHLTPGIYIANVNNGNKVLTSRKFMK